jgi:hypothetical protein
MFALWTVMTMDGGQRFGSRLFFTFEIKAKVHICYTFFFLTSKKDLGTYKFTVTK